MTNYTKTTDFAAKDALPSGNSAKIVKGTEIDTEFNNIATASATKANKNDAALTGTTTFETISDGTIAITAFVDEDNMASDSATLLPTQQSVKAYVDSQVTAQDLDVTDGSTSIDIDLDSESLGILGGTGIDSTALGTNVTLAIDSTVATLTGSQTLSNKTLSAPVVSGNLTTDGLLDGRDVAADGTKLDGIESGATADQTAAEIKTAYESNANTNAFTDADESKLDGIEASADVTDTANVTAAGALMDSELTSEASVKALNQGVATTDSPTFAGLTTTADVSFGDNDKAIFGAGSDLQIYHDASHSFIKDSGTGHLKIQATNLKLQDVDGNNYIDCIDGSYVRLMHNTATKLETTSTGIDVTGVITTDGMTTSADINFADNAKAIFGAGSDLEIFSDGTNGRISLNSAAGNLRMLADEFQLANTGYTNFYLTTTAADAVLLYHGGDQKFETTSTGIDVTGRAVVDGLTSSASIISTSNSNSLGGTTFTSAISTVGLSSSGAITSTSNSNSLGGTSFTSSIDVTGTVTADGLTVNSGATSTTVNFQNSGTAYATLYNDTNGVVIFSADAGNTGAASRMQFNVGGSQAFRITDGGDISFYEDTGTTPKMVWDSSAESLGIGTSSPDEQIHLHGGSSATRLRISGGALNETYGGFIEGEGVSGQGGHLRLGVVDNGTDRVAIEIEEQGNQIVFSTASTERMRIDSSGNLLVSKTGTGIGTVGVEAKADGQLWATRDGNPVLSLNRKTSNGSIAVFYKDGSTAGSIAVKADTSNNYMIIGKGSVGMQYASDSEANSVLPARPDNQSLRDAGIDLGASGTRFKDLYLSGDVKLANNSQITFASTSCNIEGNSSGADFIKFTTAGGERVRIDSTGNLLVNTTTQSGQITVDNGGNNTGVYVHQSSSSVNHTGISVKSSYVTGGQTGTMVRFIQTSDATVGTISSTITSTAYNTSSDQRLKDNIVDAPSASDDIDAIQVRSFDWKADGSHQKYGMVAQELQSVAPEAVSGDADSEDMMGVDYSKLVPMMLKEIQSLRARVAQLEGE